MKPFYILFFSLVFALSGYAQTSMPPAHEEGAPQYEFQLQNGLTLWVKPDHRSPTVTHMVWYRVGSRDEVDGTSGVAHLLEHMMFRGTKNIEDGAFSRRVAELGGNDNAFTSYDMTAYYQQIPIQALPEMMSMEADRMVNLVIDEERFTKELEVVKEERRMRTDENPRSQLWERLQATLYMTDPYRRPVIGWMSDLDAMKVSDAQNFYKHWYRPDNAAVVIVGDITPKAALALAQNTYGKIPTPTTPLQQSKPRIEPEQSGVKRIEHQAVASQSYLMMAFKVPGVTQLNAEDALSQDAYALTMLSAVLDGSSSARLQRALVQGEGREGVRVADSVGAGYGISGRGPVTFMLYGVPSQGHTVDELEQALRAEIERIARDGVDSKELERIKIQWVASQVYAKDSQGAQAEDLGGNWILGFPPEATVMMIDQLRAVTPEQVQSVAARYFRDEHLTVGVLQAQDAAGAEPSENDVTQNAIF